MYSSYIAVVFNIIVLLTNGFTVFTKGNWDAASFVSAYLDIPLVLAAFTIWKLLKKTKVVNLADIPLGEALDQADQYPDEEYDRKPTFMRILTFSWLWD